MSKSSKWLVLPPWQNGRTEKLDTRLRNAMLHEEWNFASVSPSVTMASCLNTLTALLL
jgi:hypothetical protein